MFVLDTDPNATCLPYLRNVFDFRILCKRSTLEIMLLQVFLEETSSCAHNSRKTYDPLQERENFLGRAWTPGEWTWKGLRMASHFISSMIAVFCLFHLNIIHARKVFGHARRDVSCSEGDSFSIDYLHHIPLRTLSILEHTVAAFCHFQQRHSSS